MTDPIDPAEALHLARLQAEEHRAQGGTRAFAAFLSAKYGLGERDVFRATYEVARATAPAPDGGVAEA
jgi:hypothetical protein